MFVKIFETVDFGENFGKIFRKFQIWSSYRKLWFWSIFFEKHDFRLILEKFAS